ncbi:integrator complex subunit 6 [Culicoides brevitarsis]|uniref:integrator complex subunit 6 n=1 Tax=Culicoides brevitarsis TaxID=469753 RepID=UPI00307C8A2A
MTIILFLIDTSASMSQKAHVNGVQKSYLDIAKGAVETFLKYRQRSQDCMGDRYMLLTFEDPPGNVKAGWKENHATFMNELKNLQSNGLTSMGEALKNAFDLLNLNRMVSGIDTYGQGRCPFYLEPSVIIVITDGGRYSYRNGIHHDIVLPLHAQIPGAKLTKEPFRWDQRLFSLVLRMAGNRMEERVEGKVPHDDSPIEKMCEVTGGRSYKVRSQYVLNQCIESLVQKVQPGVVVHFDQLVFKDMKDGEVQDIAFQPTKKMIYVVKAPQQKAFPVGYWPIPEPYWPDSKSASLPPRDAHPKIRIISPCIDEPPIVRNFPIDKYELEACPLTLQILSKKEPNKVWPLLVSNQNGMHGNEMPFGYLKANSTLTIVHMYVLPYNYHLLLPLINDFFQKFNGSAPNEWIVKFSNYVRAIPQYYCPFLRRALLSANIPYPFLGYILPENLDNYLSASIATYLKTMKNTAKQDQENLCLRVFKQLKLPKPPYHQIETAKLNVGLQLKRDLVTHPMLKETFTKLHQDIAGNLYENYTITVPTLTNSVATKNYRNPFDIPRKDLIDEVARMRENFLRLPTNGISLFTKDAGHCLPIAEMGNYQEYLKNKETPLRELEPTNVRQHMFGNPYKKDKNMVMVDEADLGEMAPMKNMTGQNMPKRLENKTKQRRKAGPLKKDFVYERVRTSSESSSILLDSPCPSPMSIGSDIEDDAASSDTSSVMSTSEIAPSSENRLDFEFNEPAIEDFSMNGHVQSFINGDTDEDDAENAPPVQIPRPPIEPPTLMAPISFVNNVIAPPISSQATQNGQNPASIIAPIVSVPPVVATLTPQITPQVASSSSHHHNDLNDAQEISKILQTCHNGGNSTSSTPVIITNNVVASPIAANNHSEFESDAENAPPNAQEHENASKAVHLVNSTPHPLLTNHNANNNNNTPLAAQQVNPHTNHINHNNNNNNFPEDDDETKENIRQQNMETRNLIFKEIRKPGRDYRKLIEHLDLIRGNFDTKFTFVQMCINESLRFRRKRMADSIQEWWNSQVDQLS